MPIDWEQRALQLEKDNTVLLHKVKQLLAVVQGIKHQIFIADNLRDPDELDKYRYTYP